MVRDELDQGHVTTQHVEEGGDDVQTGGGKEGTKTAVSGVERVLDETAILTGDELLSYDLVRSALKNQGNDCGRQSQRHQHNEGDCNICDPLNRELNKLNLVVNDLGGSKTMGKSGELRHEKPRCGVGVGVGYVGVGITCVMTHKLAHNF